MLVYIHVAISYHVKCSFCKFEDAMIFLYGGNFGEVFNFGDLAKIVKLKKLTNGSMDSDC